MLDRKVSLPSVEPYPAAPTPTVSKARVESKGAVHQPDRRCNVLAKVTQHMGSMGKYAWIVTCDSKGLSSEVDRLTLVFIPTVCPATYVKLDTALGRKGEGGTVARIALDRLIEQVEGLDDSLFFVGAAMWKRAQVDIVRVEIARGSFARSADLSDLQCRLNHPSNVYRHFVLKLEYIFH